MNVLLKARKTKAHSVKNRWLLHLILANRTFFAQFIAKRKKECYNRKGKPLYQEREVWENEKILVLSEQCFSVGSVYTLIYLLGDIRCFIDSCNGSFSYRFCRRGSIFAFGSDYAADTDLCDFGNCTLRSTTQKRTLWNLVSRAASAPDYHGTFRPCLVSFHAFGGLKEDFRFSQGRFTNPPFCAWCAFVFCGASGMLPSTKVDLLSIYKVLFFSK